MTRGFKQPKSRETHHYVFDRKTGEILASVTLCVDEGSDRADSKVPRELIQSLAADCSRTERDLDVLQARRRTSVGGRLRVDVSKRQLASERTAKSAALAPLDLGRQ